MTKPKPEKPYLFVRVADGLVEHTKFTRYDDGSAGFTAEGFVHCYELRPDAWRKALDDLQSIGFVELREAEAAGIIPPGWRPA
jgi:hypothetical protein